MAADEDPYRALEDIDSAASMTWVEAQNAVSTKELQGDPRYDPTYRRLIAILDSTERIPEIGKMGPWFYNFWRDATHVRGVMRRTSLDEYRKASPAWGGPSSISMHWPRAEQENWVWKGWTCLYPAYQRCIVALSRGGADATVRREFDLEGKTFIAPDAGGFHLPEAKSNVGWIDDDHLFVGTDFGPGTMTDSGYARIVKRWTRGTPLSAAEEVLAGERTDVSVDATRHRVRIGDAIVYRTIVSRALDFFSGEHYELTTKDGRPSLVKLDLPVDVRVGLWRDQLIVTTRKPWPAAPTARRARPTRPARCSLSASTVSSTARATSRCCSRRARGSRSVAWPQRATRC